MKNIAILGSTGSVGTQALEVIGAHPGEFYPYLLSSNVKGALLTEQAIRFKPKKVVIGDPGQYLAVKQALSIYDIDVLAGNEALLESVEDDMIDLVLTAVVGYCGLAPTIRAIQKGKTIALANKETLVVAGELIMDLCRKHYSTLLPVDSEHSAIFQCLAGEKRGDIEKIILTASGGPFRDKNATFLKAVTPEQALKHPNWTMGPKISIDSASMMNKGLEVIEARWLFDLPLDKIDVLIHPQSIIHSMVQFTDGSIKAQMGPADMRTPIHVALSYPHRLAADFPRYDFISGGALTFDSPDLTTFRNLGLAFEALKRGGNMPCILNAANEVAVSAFLDHKISFLAMSDLIEYCMGHAGFIQKPGYEDYVASHLEVCALAQELVDSGFSPVKIY